MPNEKTLPQTQDELVDLLEEAEDRGRKSMARSIVMHLVPDLDDAENALAVRTLEVNSRPPTVDLTPEESARQVHASCLRLNSPVAPCPYPAESNDASRWCSEWYRLCDEVTPGGLMTEASSIDRATPVSYPVEVASSLNTPESSLLGDGVPVWDLVRHDMKERDRFGTEKYGTPLRAHNGRRSLVDLYQELLDAVVYVRQEIEERKDPLTVWLIRVVGDNYAVKATKKDAQDVIDELLSSTGFDLEEDGDYDIEEWMIGQEADDWKTAA